MARQNVLRVAISVDIPVDVTNQGSVALAAQRMGALLEQANSVGAAMVTKSHYATIAAKRAPTQPDMPLTRTPVMPVVKVA